MLETLKAAVDCETVRHRMGGAGLYNAYLRYMAWHGASFIHSVWQKDKKPTYFINFN